MILEFYLNLPAFTVNKSTYRDIRFKSAAYKSWATKVDLLLKANPDLQKFSTYFHAQSKYAIQATFTVIYPEKEYYNADGEISSYTIDVTNFEKLLQDLIFTKNLKINDKYVKQLISRKEAGPDVQIKITLEAKAEKNI